MLFWPSSNKIKGIGSGERRKRKAGRGRGGKRKEGELPAKNRHGLSVLRMCLAHTKNSLSGGV